MKRTYHFMKGEWAFANTLLSGPWRFRRPEKELFAVYDQQSVEVATVVLPVSTFFTLHIRGETTHVHWSVVLRCLGLWVKLHRLRLAYAASVLATVDPQVVFTFIDNDPDFHELSNVLSGRCFLALQNGTRFPYYDSWLPSNRSYESTLLCFGQNDIDNYDAMDVHFKSVIKVGSVMNSLWLGTATASPGADRDHADYDLCVVSQFRYPPMLSEPFWNDVRTHAVHIAHFLTTRPEIRVAVALFYQPGAAGGNAAYEAEVDFFQSILGSDVALLPNDRERMSTYRAADSASVTTAAFSTAALEAAARGRRVLMDLTDNEGRFPPLALGGWYLHRADGLAFETALARVLDITDEEYLAEYEEQIRYVMESHSMDEIRTQISSITGTAIS